jgi:hypothetical protein
MVIFSKWSLIHQDGKKEDGFFRNKGHFRINQIKIGTQYHMINMNKCIKLLNLPRDQCKFNKRTVMATTLTRK